MNWTPRQRLYPRDNLRQPLRILLDSQNRITPQHRVVQQPGATGWARLQADAQTSPQDVEQFICPAHGGGVDLVVMMMLLAAPVNSIWVEAGASLAGALLQAGTVDELILYIAPKLLRIMAVACATCRALERLADAPEFVFSDVRQVGPDLRLRLRAKH